MIFLAPVTRGVWLQVFAASSLVSGVHQLKDRHESSPMFRSLGHLELEA
jgi:hypothetical protein